MTTPQPAALPEKLIFSERLAISEAAQVPMDAECCRVIQATLDYISSNYALAALQPQPASAVSDEEISRLWSWSATAEAERTATTQQHAFAYALLALRPQAVPMTREEKLAAWKAATIELPSPENCYLRGLVDAEAHHRITQRADGAHQSAKEQQP